MDHQKDAIEIKNTFEKTFLPDAIDLKYYEQLNSWVIFVDRKTMERETVAEWILAKYEELKNAKVNVKFANYRASQLKTLMIHAFEKRIISRSTGFDFSEYNYFVQKKIVQSDVYSNEGSLPPEGIAA
jgi:hypothetical protein